MELPITISKLSFLAEITSVLSTKLTSNVNWALNCSESWITASQYSGTGNATIDFTVGPNLSDSTRSAVVTISSDKTDPVTINILQKSYLPNTIANYNYDNIKIYPNPIIDNFCLKFEGLNAILNIYNMDGKLLSAQKVNNNSLVDMTCFSNGIYILMLYVNGNSTIMKLVKNNSIK